MALITSDRFKIAIGPDSNKVQGLHVGDVVLRKYYNNTTQFYSLLIVDEIGTNPTEGDFFIGKLIDGMEPGATGTELLDFVRVTSVMDTDRMGALYMTGSESNAPFLDVVDNLGRDASVFWPEGKDENVGYFMPDNAYASSYYNSTDRHFYIIKTSATPDSNSIQVKMKLEDKLSVGTKYLISYKYLCTTPASITSRISNSDSSQPSAMWTDDYINEWKYKAEVFECTYVGADTHFILSTGTAGVGSRLSISDFNIIPVDSLINRKSDLKSRIGKLYGVNDNVFGEIQGYGGYFKRLYATQDVNIAGTLTAGDANGFGNTFMAGRIRKNLLANSETVLGAGVRAVGAVINTKAPTKLTDNATRYTISTGTSSPQITTTAEIQAGKTYTFSVWIKPSSSLGVSCDRFKVIFHAPPLKGLYDSNYKISSGDLKFEEWSRISVTGTFSGTGIHPAQCIIDIDRLAAENGTIDVWGWQVEEGDLATSYQKTDNVISSSDDYGMWANRGGFGGTMQNPLLKLNSDGTIIGGDNKLILRPDGSAEFNGEVVIKDSLGNPMDVEAVMDSKISTYDTSLGALAKKDSVTEAFIDNNAISLSKLGVTVISGGKIKTDILNAVEIQTATVTAAKINGLTCTFGQGTIGGWDISPTSLSKGNIVISSDGEIRNTTGAWMFRNLGSGIIANGNISWDNAGNVTFTDAVKLNWANSANGIEFRYIRDWQNGSTVNTGNYWYNVSVFSGSEDIAIGATIIASATSGNLERIVDGVTDGSTGYGGMPGITKPEYIQIDLGSIRKDIDYIQLYPYFNDGRTFHDTKTEVSKDGVTWVTVLDSKVSGTWATSPLGKRISINDNSRLTKITNAGIYTGSITADQVNAARVTVLGDVTAGSFNIGTGKFSVTSEGALTASGADISGKITASSGKIANWNILDNELRYEDNSDGLGVRRISLKAVPPGQPVSGTGGAGLSFYSGAPAPGMRAMQVGQVCNKGTFGNYSNNDFGINITAVTGSTLFRAATDSALIAGWEFNTEKMWGGAEFRSGAGVEISNIDKRFMTYKDANNYSKMYYQDQDNWGVQGVNNNSEIFHLGSKNIIGGWLFSDTKLSKTLPDGNSMALGESISSPLYQGLELKTPTGDGIILAMMSTGGDFIFSVKKNGESIMNISPFGAKIAGWDLSSSGLSSGAIELSSSGMIRHAFDAWRFNSDGSGVLARGNISWDASGNVSFSPNVKLGWGQVEDMGINKPMIFKDDTVRTVPKATDFAGGVKYTITTNTSGKGLIKVQSSGDGGEIFVGLNGSEVGIMNENLADETKWYGFEVDLVKGSNLVSVWTKDVYSGGQVISVKIYGDGDSKFLTQIDSNGIYTGTLTADQVNAVSINADSIKAGTISASRIDTGSITSLGNITSGSFSLGSGKFSVSDAGFLTAKEGTIGGFRITSWEIATSNFYTGGADNRMGLNASNGTLYMLDSDNRMSSVSSDGILANNAKIQNISGTSGIKLRSSLSGRGYSTATEVWEGNSHKEYIAGVYCSTNTPTTNSAPAYSMWSEGTSRLNGAIVSRARFLSVASNSSIDKEDIMRSNVMVVKCTGTTDPYLYLPSSSQMNRWFGTSLGDITYRLTIISEHDSTRNFRPARYYHWNGAYSANGEFWLAQGDSAEFIYISQGTGGYWQYINHRS